MISGNCNRSPQYNTMEPSGNHRIANNQHSFIQRQSHQQPHLLFMAGGSVNAFPQMSRSFTMMPNPGSMHSTIVHCSVQQGFGGGTYGYPANAGPMFHQRQNSFYQQAPQNQIIHQQTQQQYNMQPSYLGQPALGINRTPTSGFINGIKNMVKGFIQPLNCDFYSDHHKNYNPKYRNNYMRDISAENMSYVPQRPDPHVKTTVVEMGAGVTPAKILETTTANTPKSNNVAVPQDIPMKKTTEVSAIFKSDDFPELPVPRRSRSLTPAKTEKPLKQKMDDKKCTSEESAEVQQPTIEQQTRTVHHTPKATYFEIKCTTAPSGRRPTFGGRLKVVPPPFSLNKSHPTCRSRQESNTHKDCDIDEDSFVIFPNERQENCLFSSFSSCRPPRQRNLSECSDDSFVVFFTEDADGLCAIESDEDDEEDDWDSDEDTSSEEDDNDDCSDLESDDDEVDNGVDVVDSSCLGKIKTDRNKCAETTLLYPEINCAVTEHAQLDSGFDEKKVTFNPKPVVHVMHAWNYAYRAARKGHWEDFARDRTRFQKRIERTSVYLNPILTPEHREKIYRSRFCDEALDQKHSQSNATNTETRSLKSNSSRIDNNQRLPKLTNLQECAHF